MLMKKNTLKKIIGITATTVGAAFVITSIIAAKKKANSQYQNDTDEQNPLEGKKVVFVEDENDNPNADGVKGHLQAIGESEHIEGIYEKIY